MSSPTSAEPRSNGYLRKHKDVLASITAAVDRPEYRDIIAGRLSRAVKIPTVVRDGMGHVGDDPRWDVFYRFTEYLRNAFPLVHECLRLTTVNEHAHLFTWEGSDSQLRPVLLMAHSDVVPAASSTANCWTYDPFSGHYDGDYIWGRGSEDDKSNLVAALSTIELLLQSPFKPARTILVAIGFDEEGGAEKSYGARCLAEVILQRYGKDGIELIFDEGMPGIESSSDTECAFPATFEKGYIDVTMRINTPGGHSQEPPAHTGIGLLAQAIQIIEDHPFEPRASINNPALASLHAATFHCDDVPGDLKSAFRDEKFQEKELMQMVETSSLRSLVQTTTAVTVVHGGDKVNSLPESTYALVNHRIAPQDSVQAVKDHYVSLLSPWADRHHLAMEAFGERLAQPPHASGALVLTSEYDLDPSPITDSNDPRFRLFARTIRAVFGAHVAVAPTILLGNTDTRYYWALSDQIYRMSPWRAGYDPRGTRIHIVDERMPIPGLMEAVKFYLMLILNVDEYRGM